ncbi:DUF2252 domain-containing protein [Undibacterium sp.]|jgi:uncharacterized protein (DUF2252 family)|uniref:DUF2252 domain-containing protein n=1 Tax=Undibacterium sp. TaxID=1914977 RepID=UPI002C29C4C0|nr:DUF2252 domain-containing protein [Undibacterium sp.]HTD02233.1 DUF2252 domain-containing protein [Undibacterium sp.]
MLEPCQNIFSFNAGRDPERLQMKYGNMRRSAFVFLRGTCHLFYDRLSDAGTFPQSPLVWCCGDLHLENFGSYKGDNRLAYFDINDFDEAALAPLSWDLVRFVTSVLVGAGSLGISKLEARALGSVFLASYKQVLSKGKSHWVERDTAQGLVGNLLDSLRQRQRSAFLDRRTVLKGARRSLRIDGKKALSVTPGQREKVTTFFDEFASTQINPQFFKVLDMARRVAGTGSLGVERYIVLVHGKGGPNGNYLLDLKQALPSSLAPHLRNAQPKWKSEADRVVALQRRIQAVSMAFLQPVTIGKRHYILRALQPTEDRVTLDRSISSLQELEEVMQVMGDVVASAHIRSSGRGGSAIADELIAFAAKKKWTDTIMGLARDCAKQVNTDWESYCKAFDQGFFREREPAKFSA